MAFSTDSDPEGEPSSSGAKVPVLGLEHAKKTHAGLS